MAKKIIEYVQVPYGTVPKLMAMFSCSKGTVYRALNLDSSTEVAQKIRKTALSDFNGVMSKKTKFL